MKTSCGLALLVLLLTATLSCSTDEVPDERGTRFAPTEVIDLGALVTEDLPERV